MKNIEEKDWRLFKIHDIFETVQRGKRLKKDDHINGVTPYVSSKAINNGLDGSCGNTENVREYNNCITLANSGSVGSCFYHPYKFIASDHVTTLSKPGLSQDSYLALTVLVHQIRQNFGFNREISDKRLKNESIMLPVTESGEPDYKFLEDFIHDKKKVMYSKYLEYVSNKLQELGEPIEILDLSEKVWKSFELNEIFFTENDKEGISKNVPTGANIKSSLFKDGPIPRITATSSDNGIGIFTKEIDSKNFHTSENFISMSFLGTAKYHPYKASLDMKIHSLKLKNKELNQYLGLFISTMLNLGFEIISSYGYQLSSKDLVDKYIFLPVDDFGNPDYLYMEQFIKNIMIKKYKNYLKYLNK